MKFLKVSFYISNLTYFDHRSNRDLKKIIAFDAGPCCSLIDDWVYKNLNKKYDRDGIIARTGSFDKKIIKRYLNNSFFSNKPPKSLDRNDFSLSLLNNLKVKDGASTLCYLVVETIVRAFKHFKKKPEICIISGGGRNNKFLIELINKRLKKIKIILSDDYNWDGDSIEAYAFAYLSVRRLLNLPITFPKTTGIKKPLIGGRIFNYI